MQISSISYSEYEGEARVWRANSLTFEAINLVVGRNAVGKTRLLNVVNALAELVSGRRKPMSTGAYAAEFQSGKTRYKYEIAFKDKTVVRELLRERLPNGHLRILLRRDNNGVGRIRTKSGKSSKLIDFQCPVQQIGVFSRQDEINHPFLVDFVSWGMSTYHFQFGRGEIKEFIALDANSGADYDPLDTKKFSTTFQQGMSEIGDEYRDSLIRDLGRVGYEIEDIQISSPEGVSLNKPHAGRLGVVSVKERGVGCWVGSHHLSAGMLRALSLIIQVNYRAMAVKPSLFIVDDIGEGLDFERTCSLIDLLMEKADSSNVQLLMSSNDRFVMNSIPLKYWVLLDRDGSEVSAMTYASHRKEFEDFRFTGLNNFDFFVQHYAESSNG